MPSTMQAYTNYGMGDSPLNGTGINEDICAKCLTMTLNLQESLNGYVQSYSRYGNTVTKGGEHDAITNTDKHKPPDLNMTNFCSK